MSGAALAGLREKVAEDALASDPAHPDRQAAHRADPGSVASLFAQFVSGYLGRSVEFRGRRADKEPLWSLMELQGLLDEWIVVWQNLPHRWAA